MAERSPSRRGLLGHIAGAGFAVVALRHQAARASDAESSGSVCQLPTAVGSADIELCGLGRQFLDAYREYAAHEEHAAPLYAYRRKVMEDVRRLGLPWEQWEPHVQRLPRYNEALLAARRSGALLTVADEFAEAAGALPAQTVGGVLVKAKVLAYWCEEYAALLPRSEEAEADVLATACFRDLFADLERLAAADPASAHLLPLLGLEANSGI